MSCRRCKADDDTINLVQDVLVMQLNRYEVMERYTEVAVRDDSAEGILKKFLATKRVEGIADSTLQRYAEINRALINYLIFLRMYPDKGCPCAKKRDLG